MARRVGDFDSISINSLFVEEHYPYSSLTKNNYVRDRGILVKPSKINGRDDITGYVLTSLDKNGKVVWAAPSGGGGGGGGSATPAGTVEGAIQLRNSSGFALDANNSLRWIASTASLNVPGNVVCSTPLLDSHAATKAYVDGIAVSGTTWKNPVAHVSDESENYNINGSTGKSMGGVSLSSMPVGTRVLLRDQSVSSQNGIYEISSNSGGNTVLERSEDASGSKKVSGSAVFVESEDKTYVVTDVVGTDTYDSATSITWSVFSTGSSSGGGGGSSLNLSGASGHVQINDGAGDLGSTPKFRVDSHAGDDLEVSIGGKLCTLNIGDHDSSGDPGYVSTIVSKNINPLKIGNTEGGQVQVQNTVASGYYLLLKKPDKVSGPGPAFNNNDSSAEYHVEVGAQETLTTDVGFYFPISEGQPGQALKTDGSGNTRWGYINSGYKFVHILGGTSPGSHNVGNPYSVQPGDRFIYVSEDTSSPSTEIDIILPDISSASSDDKYQEITIGDKSGLDTVNTTLKTITIKTASGSEYIQGYQIGKVTQFSLSGADYVGITLLSDGIDTWHLVA